MYRTADKLPCWLLACWQAKARPFYYSKMAQRLIAPLGSS
jgi:hypothetical protein